jgi:predicted nucleic-acid-binding Zn-ribbon protein
MRPSKPCPYCGATRFGVIEKARVEILCMAKRGSGNVLNQEFTACVCTGCGATTFFDPGGGNGLLEACSHKTVDVS